MDSPTGFDEDESFFESYDAQQATSLAPFEFDDADGQSPTAEELAHRARFRRPVALVVAGMGLLSIVALGKHGFQQRGSQRELVAHCESAIAAPPLATAGTVKQAGVVLEASSASIPEAWSALLADAWAALMPEASSVANSAAADPRAAAIELAPGPAFTETFPQPDASPITAFSSAPTPICLRAGESHPAITAPQPPAVFPSVARFSDLER